MRFSEAGAAIRRWHFGWPPRTRRMTASERSLSVGACQTCGAKVEISNAYCVPCATEYADCDVAYFDRWLLVFIWVAASVTLFGAIYFMSRLFGVVS